ncbi:FAD-binding protein [Nocardioides bruguierae]|uniref:FAD-binding protein n=1 Tax=Nocardioides bruguierae TaxID=2945102 RepID=UPI00202239A4|nr:FAD-binding protein [Nocardioides bruguierae]MCL8025479.1 FAD-binding protein [Nocardioides bruguierae]
MSGWTTAADGGRERNWSGNHRYTRGAFVEPADLDELRRVVAGSARVRVLGTAHSFNEGPDTPGTQVSLARLDQVRVDAEAGTCTVGGGTAYVTALPAMHEAGWALPNTGSLPHISVAGAVSTGTHGSGVGNRVVASSVTALTVVLPDGDLHTVRRGEPGFGGMVVGLGATGVIAEVELALQPTYDVVQDIHPGVTWETLLADPLAVLGAGYSVSVFTRWRDEPVPGGREGAVGDVIVKHRTDDRRPPEEVEALLGPAQPDRAPSALLGADEHLTPRGSVGPWYTRLPHFPPDGDPSFGHEDQSEWFVPLEDAAGAIAAVRALEPLLAPVLATSELRTVDADDLWLSGSAGRASLAVHFTWRDVPERWAAVAAVEEALAPFAPRPHWGKTFTRPVDLGLWEHADAWVAQRRALDPDGCFTNPYLERLGLV